MIHKCKNACSYPYQDKAYGKGMRVHTPGEKKSNGQQNFTCTVCGSTFSVGPGNNKMPNK